MKKIATNNNENCKSCIWFVKENEYIEYCKSSSQRTCVGYCFKNKTKKNCNNYCENYTICPTK